MIYVIVEFIMMKIRVAQDTMKILIFKKMNANFYCKASFDILVKYYSTIFENTTINGIINYSLSFNIEKVLHKRNDIEVFKVVIHKAIDEYNSDSHITTMLSIGAIETV